MVNDNWVSANAYDLFMGRWSQLIAREFVDWLGPQPGQRWFDLGCGTRALTGAILDRAEPRSILACDPSEQQVKIARKQIQDERAAFFVGSAGDLPDDLSDAIEKLDVFVSGLVLNFIPDPETTLLSVMQKMTKGGTVAGYAWDYADRMEFLRVFWDAAMTLDSSAAALDEGGRFPLCHPDALQRLFQQVGLRQVQTAPIETVTRFESFDDFWDPFLDGIGPAPTFVASLSPDDRRRLESTLRQRLEDDKHAAIELTARAWAVRGAL